jgi:hypothetical protein
MIERRQIECSRLLSKKGYAERRTTLNSSGIANAVDNNDEKQHHGPEVMDPLLIYIINRRSRTLEQLFLLLK